MLFPTGKLEILAHPV